MSVCFSGVIRRGHNLKLSPHHTTTDQEGAEEEELLCQVAVLHCVLHNYVSPPAIFFWGCLRPAATSALPHSPGIDRLDDIHKMMMIIIDLTTAILSPSIQRRLLIGRGQNAIKALSFFATEWENYSNSPARDLGLDSGWRTPLSEDKLTC